jgi:galactose oxidase-like protein/Kelch motif protein
MNKMFARAFACVGFALLSVIGHSGSGTAQPLPPQASPSVIGKWAEPFEIHVIAIHSVLLQNGKILFWEYHLTQGVGSVAGLWDPATGALTDVTVPYERDTFCAGEVHLPDGRVMVIGGMAYNATGNIGVKRTDFFDPVSQTWTPGPLMNETRWYPTALELPDGSVFAMGGQHNDQSVTREVERYDVLKNTFTRLPERANLNVGLFPRTFILPTGSIFRAGDAPDTEFFDPASKTWHFVDNFRVGGRYDGNMILLPGLKKVLAAGGAPDGSHATATAEIIDVSSNHPRWRYTAPMHHARLDSNAVLLPDGTVLVVGGGFGFPYHAPVKAAELFDPMTETWTEMAAQEAPRIYHSTAVLLPDGRVFSAGSDDPNSKFQTKAEIYSPPYLFKGSRPEIVFAPSRVSYNESFDIGSREDARVSRVVLIKLGATTHAVNFDQRYLALHFQSQDEQITATSPAGPTLAPPGWYMLFLVDSRGIPSVARMIWLG